MFAVLCIVQGAPGAMLCLMVWHFTYRSVNSDIFTNENVPKFFFHFQWKRFRNSRTTFFPLTGNFWNIPKNSSLRKNRQIVKQNN